MGFFSRLFGGAADASLAGPQPRLRDVRCAGPQRLHRMAYREWGDPANPRVLVCVHGLTRNACDFDDLARTLCRDYRVICPDVVGRGRSEWLADPSAYGFPQYIADMMVLLARLDVEQVHWVGTSMGGLIGMFIAAQPDSPISRLVLNDVGPVITPESLRRIGEYVGKAPAFPDLAAAEQYIRSVSAPFGALSDDQWRRLTESSVKRRDDGFYAMIYDPAIGKPFEQAYLVQQPVDLWPIYDTIRCPTLAVRGALSDLLTVETHAAMGARGPKAKCLEIQGVGHAPMFMDATQIAAVQEFLLSA